MPNTAGRGLRSGALAILVAGAVACGGSGQEVQGAPPGPPRLVSIEIGPAAPLVAQGVSQQLVATGRYSDGSTGALTAVEWSSSAPTTIAVSAGGLASFVSVGRSVEIAAVDPATAVSGTLTIPARHVAFVTSVMGNGDLGSWVSYVATGAAAGDEVCQRRAAAAGIPGAFKAWLSDSRDDAFCRVQGLRGRRAANCGQAAPPALAGPWVRTDGLPLAPAIGGLVDGIMYTAVLLDEFGDTRIGDAWAWTNTGGDGTLGPDHSSCGDWTAADESVSALGMISSAATTWTYTAPGLRCDWPALLLCMQSGGGPALPTASAALPSARRAFITSRSGSGDLSTWTGAGGATGIAAGDAVCQALALESGLSGTFKAWLSDSATDAIDRLASAGPWVTLDGAVVAATRLDLASLARSAIVVTETGDYLTSPGESDVVWTGTRVGGTRAPESCGDWSDQDAASMGMMGVASAVGRRWTEYAALFCDEHRRLYCFEE
jgi:hypothetical protein